MTCDLYTKSSAFLVVTMITNSAFKPNRDLFNVNFQGYKLSEKPLNVIQEALPCAVSAVQPQENEFSYQRMRAYSLHNHLHSDPSSPSSAYWCAKDGSIRKVTSDGSSICYEDVLRLPPVAMERATNATMEFLGANVGVVCSGGNEVAVFSRKSQGDGEKWTILKSLELSENDPIMLTTASLGATGAHADVLCAEISKPTAAARKEPEVGVATYKWVRIGFKSNPALSPPGADDVGSMTMLGSFQSKSLALYAAFQLQPPSGETQLLFVSETTPLIESSNSETRVRETGAMEQDASLFSEPASHHGLGYQREDYTWTQTGTDVSLVFQLAEGVGKRDISCVMEPQELVVGLTDGTTLLRGELVHSIDPEASNWILEKNM